MTGPEAKTPRSVLFLCNLNAVRSPMAKALADHHCRRRVFVDSAGIRAGELDGFAVAAMDELGLDILGHEPKQIGDVTPRDFDLIVTLSPEAHHRALEFTLDSDLAVEYWPTPDPTATQGSREVILDAYRAVRDRLKTRIAERFDFAAPGHL